MTDSEAVLVHLSLLPVIVLTLCGVCRCAGLQQQRPIIPGEGTTLGGLQRLLLERRGRVLSVLEDQNTATHLIRHALGDDGYGAVAPNRLAKMLSLPVDLARRYRDDITITIIHLNEI